MSEQFIKEVYEGVVARDAGATVAAVQKAVDAGADPMTIIEEGLTKGMETVGEKFEAADYFLPDLLLASACVKKAMGLLNPLMASDDDEKKCTMVIGTIEGDIHDIGKNLVAVSLEATGFNVIDLGVSVTAAAFIDAIKEHEPDMLGMSALITSTMVNMETTIKEIEKAGLRDKVKIVVGGAPLDQEYADLIGADYYGRTVRDTMIIGKNLKEVKVR